MANSDIRMPGMDGYALVRNLPSSQRAAFSTRRISATASN